MEERKSESHEVFKWIISVLYKEPSSKYYWENFNVRMFIMQEEVFKNDKGKDFKERMGRLSAAELKEDEKVQTQKFIKAKNQISDHPDFSKKGVKEEINKIFNVAELILEGAELAKKSKDLDALDMKVHSKINID